MTELKKVSEAATSEELKKKLIERVDALVDSLFESSLRDSILKLQSQIKKPSLDLNRPRGNQNRNDQGEQRRNFSSDDQRRFSRSNQNQ